MAVAAALAVAAAACGDDSGGGDRGAGGTAVPELAAAAREGERLAGEKGCTSCHEPDGSGAGPSWEGMWGTEATLSDGTTVTVDRAYVERAIRDPRSEVLDGYQPIMPEVALTDAEVDDLVAYIEALGAGNG